MGFLGRLAPAKGVEELLDAWERIPRDSAELIIGGDGEAAYVRGLRERASGANVRWLGFCGAGEFLEEIDLLVVPSKWEEPAGLIIHEAMSHGVPVLGAARGGIPEMIGGGGWTYRGGVQELGNALAAIVSDPEGLRERGRAALEIMRSNSVDMTLDKYERVYSSLLNC